MNLLRSTAVVGGLTLASRVLGFARDQATAALLGAGPITDAFIVAFRFPNLFRRIFAEGAFNAAFVPMYARRLEGEGEEEADRFASETLSFLIVALAAFVIAAQIAMPWLMVALAPGYLDDPSWMGRTTLLAQITMPYLLFMAVTASLAGVLNARDRFVAAAASPILLNVVLLVALLLAPQDDPERIVLYLAVGAAASGLAQAAVVVWGCWRLGLRIRIQTPKLTPGVKRLLSLGVPGALAAGMTQINITVSMMVATLEEGANALIYFADRLYQLPLGIIGIALGVALVPALSRRLRAGDDPGAKDALNRAIEIAALFTAPAVAALIAAPDFWIKALFEHGAFTAEDTRRTGQALLAFAFGLPAFIAIKVLAPGFFARENTRTPMVYASLSAVLNIIVGVTLFFLMGFVGLALATSLAGWFNAVMLARTLRKDGLLVLDDGVRRRTPRILAAAGVMGVAVYFAADWATGWMDAGFLRDVGIGLALAFAGFLVYALAALLLGGARPSDLRGALRRSG